MLCYVTAIGYKEGKYMLKERVISALIGVPILVGFLFLGKIPFFVLVVILVIAGLDEFYSIARELGKHPVVLLGMIGGSSFCLAALLAGERSFPIVLATFLILLLTSQFLDVGTSTLSDTATTLFGSLYVGFLFSYLILIRGISSHGPVLVLLLFITTWVYDIVAYAAGRAIGRRKLAPRISPGKTWEGAIVGALASILLLSSIFFIPWFSLGHRILLGIVIGLVSPFGDLAESKLKREAGIKDTSSRIPGHGGILDRFDSLLFTTPIAYYLFKMVL
jgi:phosphatidate cytidylyltransferase